MNARVSSPVTGEVRPMPNTITPTEPTMAERTAPEIGDPVATTPKTQRRGGRRLLLMISIPLVLAVAGGYFWLTGGRYEDTDNAYVKQSVVSLSADISGRIIDVDVKQNQMVKAGQVLFHIDPAPYKIALDQAEAQLAAARVNVEQLRVSYSTAEAKLEAAQATLAIHQREQDRVTSLAVRGFSTVAASDDALLTSQQAETDVALGTQALASAAAALGGDPLIETDTHPTVRTALAAVDNAKRNLAATTVVAPSDGVISQVDSLNAGQFVATGQTIASLVEDGKSWIEANFKETQISTMQVGQPADASVDTYSGTVLHGKVASIGAATGSEFSLIPAQNATGNWVKVVQRIPVRIVLDANSGLDLRSGMSATVTVDTGKSRLDLMR